MSRRVRIVRTALVFAGVVTLALGVRWWNTNPRHAEPIGVVVITLDTTRADRLSLYGYMNVSLPHLERLAREGVVFERAVSVAPLTLPAHTSLFTGLLPPNHHVRDNADAPLAESHTTLAEILQARGFRTGAFVGSIVLGPERGVRQGFEQYQGVAETGGQGPESLQRRADAVVDNAVQWIDSVKGDPFFLWAHLYDAHRPYNPPEPYASTYGHNLYVGEIAFADSQIGRLLEALEQRSLLERTIVVVAGDHGESLGDHGERDHGVFIYEEVLRVPLLIRAPSLLPNRVGAIARLTDVLPTVLELLNIPSPAVDGVSLRDLMTGRRNDLDLEAYSESLYPERLGWSPLRALRDDRFKLIDAPRPELYDLDQDPFERHNIYGERPATAQAMSARLAQVAKGRGTAPAPDQRTTASPEVQARLAALGYVTSTVVRAASASASLPDPKDCIGTYAGGVDAPAARPQCVQGPKPGLQSRPPKP